jgi:hypothetical protein
MKRSNSVSVWFPVLLVVALAACSSNSNQPTDANSAKPATPASSPGLFSKPAIVIPAGTELTVRLESAVNSKSSHDGDPFEASLAEPVAVGEKVVIPKGASASGVVTQAHAAGKFKGGATLALALKSVTVNDMPYAIETSISAQQTKGKGKRTAGLIGGGAAGGAIIGALAGGGKGAAIGAAVGAGAGTAGAAFTGNRDISLPVETLVRFKLNSDVSIKQK